MSVYPNVLIVSNTCFSYTGNLGRTLSNLFEGWPADRLSQLYFHSGVPGGEVCRSYFRFSDADALRSVIDRKHRGLEIDARSGQDVRCAADQIAAYGYSLIRGEKSSVVRLAREVWWSLSNWDSPRLRAWVRGRAPQVILFVVGDCLFTYRIVNRLADDLDIPVVPLCLDDYLSDADGSRYSIGNFLQKHILKQAAATMDRSRFLLTACEGMSRDYAQKYGRECREIYTVASKPEAPAGGGREICYFGNIGLGRWSSLLAIGKAVRSLGLDGIHVYSGEKPGAAEKWLTVENGIFFHGSIPYQEVKEKTARSILLLHVESFDQSDAERVRYSISTKIADGLASGICIFAYGPAEVNSIQYLKRNHAAYVVTDEKDLAAGLREILEDDGLRGEVIRNAVNLARTNHSREHNQRVLLEVLNDSLDAGPVEG